MSFLTFSLVPRMLSSLLLAVPPICYHFSLQKTNSTYFRALLFLSLSPLIVLVGYCTSPCHYLIDLAEMLFYLLALWSDFSKFTIPIIEMRKRLSFTSQRKYTRKNHIFSRVEGIQISVVVW